MVEFSFEIIDDASINMEYVYGNEKFVLNLFQKQGNWTLHPFNGILLHNRELCRLVMVELFKNKHFQIMLAKENILLSQVRTSIDLNPSDTEHAVYERGSNDSRDQTMEDYIENNSLTDIILQEKQYIEERTAFFKNILQKMFMDNYGPGDKDFDQVQEIVRAYNDTVGRLNALIDNGLEGRDRRRF